MSNVKCKGDEAKLD